MDDTYIDVAENVHIVSMIHHHDYCYCYVSLNSIFDEIMIILTTCMSINTIILRQE